MSSPAVPFPRARGEGVGEGWGVSTCASLLRVFFSPALVFARIGSRHLTLNAADKHAEFSSPVVLSHAVLRQRARELGGYSFFSSVICCAVSTFL